MKLTKSKLQQLIREALEDALYEDDMLYEEEDEIAALEAEIAKDRKNLHKGGFNPKRRKALKAKMDRLKKLKAQKED